MQLTDNHYSILLPTLTFDHRIIDLARSIQCVVLDSKGIGK